LSYFKFLVDFCNVLDAIKSHIDACVVEENKREPNISEERKEEEWKVEERKVEERKVEERKEEERKGVDEEFGEVEKELK
jgi:predicted RNA-binding protein